jgi:hypothetical protein
VALARTSFRPHLTVTPLSPRNSPDPLDCRGLAPPTTGACPAYTERDRITGPFLVPLPGAKMGPKLAGGESNGCVGRPKLVTLRLPILRLTEKIGSSVNAKITLNEASEQKT